MHIVLVAAYASPEGGLDLTTPVAKIRLLLISLVSVALIAASVWAIFVHGRKGNTKGSFSVASASLVGLLPAALGVGVFALAYGQAILAYFFPNIGN